MPNLLCSSPSPPPQAQSLLRQAPPRSRPHTPLRIMSQQARDRVDEAANSVARSGEHETAVKSCVWEASQVGLKNFVITGLVSTAAVVGATYAFPLFRARLGPSGKAGLAVIPPSSFSTNIISASSPV